MTVIKHDAVASRNKEHQQKHTQPPPISAGHHAIKHVPLPHRFTISPTPVSDDFNNRIGRSSEMTSTMLNHSFLITPLSSPPPRIISSILKKTNLRYNNKTKTTQGGVTEEKNPTTTHSSSSTLSSEFEPPSPTSAFSSCEFPSLSSKKSSSVFRLERSPSLSSIKSTVTANNGNISSSSISTSTPRVHVQTTQYEVPSLKKSNNISRSASPSFDSNTVSPHQLQEEDETSPSPYQQHSVRFHPNVYKKIIPNRSNYTDNERRNMWSSLEEIRIASKRNILEFSYDQWKWRNATEEQFMYYNSKTGRHDIHPAINAFRIRQQEYILLQRKEEQSQRQEQQHLYQQQQQKQRQLQDDDNNNNNNNENDEMKGEEQQQYGENNRISPASTSS